jgi:hypothetical protein
MATKLCTRDEGKKVPCKHWDATPLTLVSVTIFDDQEPLYGTLFKCDDCGVRFAYVRGVRVMKLAGGEQ